MTEPPERAADRRAADERRRRRAAVFGDLLPEATRDDRPDHEPAGADAGDDWLRANVPPHHG